MGGGCEIKEVRYRDGVVWKKEPEYYFKKTGIFSNHYDVYVQGTIIDNNLKKIHVALDYVTIRIVSKGLSFFKNLTVSINSKTIYNGQAMGVDFKKDVRIIDLQKNNFVALDGIEN